MKIISEINKDIRSSRKVPGSYEWWYFDAVSKNGLTVVIIFYDGNPFSRRYIQSLKEDVKASPSDFPAITISLYKYGVPLFYSFEETRPDQAEFSFNEPFGRVGRSSFSLRHSNGSRASYLLQLNQVLPNGESLEASLDLAFKPDNSLSKYMENSSADVVSSHEWNLVVPRGEATGKLRLNDIEYDFDGTGYHDHNTGLEPLKESFDEWYWGRYHLKEGTLIYYLVRGKSGWNHKVWLIGNDGTVLNDQFACHLEDEGYNLYGLVTARKIIFKSASGEWLLQKSKLIDNGPFYQRFEGRLMGKYDGKLTQGHGISEYLHPARVYAKVFWPLVDMRIKYPGKPHWVQKSKRLHRWTWQRS